MHLISATRRFRDSDSLGFNQILDAWEKAGIEVVRISGIV